MRNERGFTLLEVLAAVSLLIVLFIPLVRSAIDGLRSEGQSRRRMEASLLADNALAEIESGIAIGDVPGVGEEITEEREFLIFTAVTSFDLPFPIGCGGLPKAQVEAAEAINGRLGISHPVHRKYNVLTWVRGYYQDRGENQGPHYEAIKREQQRLGRILNQEGIGI